MTYSKKNIYAVYVIMICVITAWLRILFVEVYPYKPIEIHQIYIVDNDNTVAPGEHVNYVTEYTKHMELPATVRRQLVNGYVLNLPISYGDIPSGCGRTLNRIRIPEFADPGEYTIQISYTYLVSGFPVKYVTVRAESNPFRVER